MGRGRDHVVALWAVARGEAGAGGWAGLRASPMGSGPRGICGSRPWLPQMVPLDPVRQAPSRHLRADTGLEVSSPEA